MGVIKQSCDKTIGIDDECGRIKQKYKVRPN